MRRLSLCLHEYIQHIYVLLKHQCFVSTTVSSHPGRRTEAGELLGSVPSCMLDAGSSRQPAAVYSTSAPGRGQSCSDCWHHPATDATMIQKSESCDQDAAFTATPTAKGAELNNSPIAENRFWKCDVTLLGAFAAASEVGSKKESR